MSDLDDRGNDFDIGCDEPPQLQITCRVCDRTMDEWQYPEHDQAHRSAIVESHNQRLTCELIPIALGDAFGTLNDALSVLIGEYAAIVMSDVPYTGDDQDQDSFLAFSDSEINTPSPLRSLPPPQPKIEYKQARYEKTRMCIKLNDGLLLTAMRVITDFGSYLNTRTCCAVPVPVPVFSSPGIRYYLIVSGPACYFVVIRHGVCRSHVSIALFIHLFKIFETAK